MWQSGAVNSDLGYVECIIMRRIVVFSVFMERILIPGFKEIRIAGKPVGETEQTEENISLLNRLDKEVGA